MTGEWVGKGWSEVAAHEPDGARVLVVEDDARMRALLDRTLTGLGYRVSVASSAEDADQYLETGRFEVCLLDIALPRMSGVEFLGWALRRDPLMAVIMLTGLDVRGLAVECLRRGARTYLVKPFDVEFLDLALRDAVAVRSLLEACSRGGTGSAGSAGVEEG